MFAIAACKSERTENVTNVALAVGDKDAYAAKMDADCAKGVASACTSVGVQTAFGTYDRVKDPVVAVAFLERGCDGGDIRGCQEMGVMYMYGRGVEQDYSKAAEIFDTGCDAEIANSCHYLGQFYERGQGVEKSADKAKEYFARACAAGSTSSCDRQVS